MFKMKDIFFLNLLFFTGYQINASHFDLIQKKAPHYFDDIFDLSLY